MQSKVSVPTSNPEMRRSRTANRWAAAFTSLAAVLVLGSASELFARTPAPAVTGAAPASVTQLGATDPAFGHVANSDQDVGPGEAESILAQHPGNR